CPEYVEVSAESNGVRNGYRDINQLGVDRWLAMIAARDKYNGNLCVVDCGSAVTIDMVDADGQHQGGYIIPGHYLMQQSLVNNTSRLSVSGVYKPTVALGRSTGECINNGTILAVSCLIEHVIQTAGTRSSSDYKCIITGGGAAEVMALLKIDYSHEPLLVIDGIRLLGGPGT
ncbi:MAG: type III pantothenate kinase, partial [Gammaproteobacteria bacterium]